VTKPTIGGTISVTKSWPMAACLPIAEQRKPILRFSLLWAPRAARADDVIE
jgi:hypothetical protein